MLNSHSLSTLLEQIAPRDRRVFHFTMIGGMPSFFHSLVEKNLSDLRALQSTVS